MPILFSHDAFYLQISLIELDKAPNVSHYLTYYMGGSWVCIWSKIGASESYNSSMVYQLSYFIFLEHQGYVIHS